MSALDLLEQARKAGLQVSAEGDQLRIRGPRASASLAKLLIQNKAEIVLLITPDAPFGGISVSGGGDETSPAPEETGVSSPPVDREQNHEAPTADELRFWLGCLRDAGCRIALEDGVPSIAWGKGMGTAGRIRDWQENLSTISALLAAEPSRVKTRRKRSTVSTRPRDPPEEIIATPALRCPRCHDGVVLRELRALTGSVCWMCWESNHS